MNKPRWSNKWHALQDMKAAKNVAVGTISQGTMMVRGSASAATTTKAGMPQTLNYPVQQEAAEMMMRVAELWQELHSKRTLYQQEGVYQQFYTDQISPYQSFSQQEQKVKDTTPSASSITPSKEYPAAFKAATIQVTGKLVPSTSM